MERKIIGKYKQTYVFSGPIRTRKCILLLRVLCSQRHTCSRTDVHKYKSYADNPPISQRQLCTFCKFGAYQLRLTLKFRRCLAFRPKRVFLLQTHRMFGKDGLLCSPSKFVFCNRHNKTCCRLKSFGHHSQARDISGSLQSLMCQSLLYCEKFYRNPVFEQAT